MTAPKVDPLEKVKAWIGGNLWPIASAAALCYGGYASAQATNDKRISALEVEVERLKKSSSEHDARLTGRTDFMVCHVRNMDKIFDRLGETPACPLAVPE